jgi:hypothetical protein
MSRRHRHRTWPAVVAAALVMAGMMTAVGTASAAPLDDAIAAGVAQAADDGVTSYITVVDRATGEVVGETDNAHTQVASESIMKLFLATYYATEAGGADLLTPDRRSSLEEMIEFSDDDIASALFTSEAIPSQAQRYGLTETANADNPGEWGAARISAHDMAVFLYRMSQDPQVGPWLMGVMAQTAPNGNDGFDQYWGFNALDGNHGSKQGWGSENWTSQRNAVHSVGYTDRWFAAVLQTGGSGTYYTMHDTATRTAALIQAAPPVSLAPAGKLESVAAAAATPVEGGTATVTGWSFDPTDAAARIAVDVVDTGPAGPVTTRVTAEVDRPDVSVTTGAPGPHGFVATLPLAGAGTHTVCAYGLDGGDAADTPLGCQDLVVAAAPAPVDAVATPARWSWSALVAPLVDPLTAAVGALR